MSEVQWGDLSLMELFRLEVETQTTALSHNLLALEKSSWSNREALDSLMRAAHSIKGAARIVQVEPAVKVSHALEDCFIAAQQDILHLTGSCVDVLLKGIDLLSALGQLEASVLTEKLPSYEAKADTVVLEIEGIVTAAEKDPQPIPPSLEHFATAESTTGSLGESTRTIQVSADNLNRLMGIAGESLIDASWLQPFGESLLQLKRQQQSVMAVLQKHQQSKPTSGRAVGPAAGSNDDNELSADLAIALQSIQSCHTLLTEQMSDLDLFSRRFEQRSDRLYREVVAGHMCAFEAGAQGCDRLVRDLSRSLNKQIEFIRTGLTTQIDRDILAKLEAPITHLLTNAVVHGIEAPDQRLAKGKSAEGSIRLEALHRSGMLIVSVEDDGAGVDTVALRKKIVEKRLIAADLVAQLGTVELLEFLFLPGFSTANRVDKLAGRGYGLDLARTMAQSVGGSLQIVSPAFEDAERGLSGGTRFQFQLPLTLSVVRSLLFEVAGEPYAMSLSRIVRVVKLLPHQIYYSQGCPYFSLAEDGADKAENISLVWGHQILCYASSQTVEQSLSVIVIGEAGSQYGFCVDRLLEETDLVVRPLDPRLGKVPNVSAAALSEKGHPILILDVADVVRSAEKLMGPARLAFAPSLYGEAAPVLSPVLEAAVQKRVLVVDDSMTVRAMEKKLLQNRGYTVDVAVDGAEGWNAVRMEPYDLVVTDVDMPRMSGIELIEKMRAYEGTKNLPVIVVSYKDRAEDQMAGLNAGANYYLTKSSFHDDGLINAVVDLVGP